MTLDKKKINNFLEYIIIFSLFIIGIKKGGYYKQDSLLGIYIIQIVSAIFYMLNIKNIKKNNILSLFLIILAISYFIPVLFNAYTVSGALNFAIRIYSMSLIVLMVINSESKEKYLKFIVITTVIFCLLGFDEIGNKYLDKPLESIGSGYLDEDTGRMSSVIQYSNLLGLLCVISSIYILDKIAKGECKGIKKSLYMAILYIFTLAVILTESKMALLVYIFSTILYCILYKKYNIILDIVITTIYSFLTAMCIAKYNVYLGLVVALIIYFVYCYILSKDNKKINNVARIIALTIILVSLVCNFSLLRENGLILHIKEYFNNFNSTKLRLTYYTDALKLVFKTPLTFIFGIGGNGFRTAYETVQTLEYISLEVHSLPLQVLLEAGILGFVSFVCLIIYTFKCCKNNTYKIMLISIVVFSLFDVFLTYTFMLYMLAIIIGTCVDKECLKQTKINALSIIGITLFAVSFVISTSEIIAYVVEPNDVSNLNNSLQEQENIIKKCEVVSVLSPFDMQYSKNYIIACQTYLDIMDIKKELYNEDNVEKRLEITQKIEDITKREMKYEKYNKYALDDNIHFTLKYLSYLVTNNYKDIKEGYTNYLEDLVKNINRLKVEHAQNSLSLQLYKEYADEIKLKYKDINIILNSQKIEELLDTIK